MYRGREGESFHGRVAAVAAAKKTAENKSVDYGDYLFFLFSRF